MLNVKKDRHCDWSIERPSITVRIDLHNSFTQATASPLPYWIKAMFITC